MTSFRKGKKSVERVYEKTRGDFGREKEGKKLL